MGFEEIKDDTVWNQTRNEKLSQHTLTVAISVYLYSLRTNKLLTGGMNCEILPTPFVSNSTTYYLIPFFLFNKVH